MKKYRKKPVVIEAFQMTKERRNDNSDWPNWLCSAWQKDLSEQGAFFTATDGCLEEEKCKPVFITTLEGIMSVDWGDFIIQGIRGELYPCKPDIFEETYEEVGK